MSNMNSKGYNENVGARGGNQTDGRPGPWRHLSTSSFRGYLRDWSEFRRFCLARGCDPLPGNAELVAAYIVYLRNEKNQALAGIRRKLSVVASVHRVNGLQDPRNCQVVSECMRQLRLISGPSRAALPILVEDLREMCGTLDRSNRAVRDRCMLLLGFLGGLSRYEIAHLQMNQVKVSDEGITLYIAEGRKPFVGAGKTPDLCPLLALSAWLAVSAGLGGPLFKQIGRGDDLRAEGLSERSVATIIKIHVSRIFEGPQPKRPSFGLRLLGIIISLAMT